MRAPGDHCRASYVVSTCGSGGSVPGGLDHSPSSVRPGCKVGEVRQVLVASPAYLEARGAPTTLPALQEHDLIVFEGTSATNDRRFGGLEPTSLRVAPRLAVNGADAALAAAEHGFGIVRALSYQAADGLAAGRLRLVLPEHEPSPIPVSLVYPARRSGSSNLTAFVDAARSQLRAALSPPR